MQSSYLESSDADAVTLRVEAKNPATVISIVDGSWRVCGKGIGSLELKLPPGIYKVVAEISRDKWSELVALRDEQTQVTVPAFSIKSVVPMLGTTRSHKSHYDLMIRSQSETHFEAGTGARIFIMARNWSRSGDASELYSAPRLERWRGDKIVDLAKTGVAIREGDAAIACAVGVNPGTYVLSIPTMNGTISQSLYAIEGWETQAFVLADFRSTERPNHSGQNPPQVDAMLAMIAGDDGKRDRSYQLVEASRTAMADGRNALPEQVIEMLAHGEEMEEPMLGLMAAHILLMVRNKEARLGHPSRQKKAPNRFRLVRFDQDRFDMIVRNAAQVFGDEQPDIVALRTQTRDWPIKNVTISTPPIYRESWDCLLAASHKSMPDLVPESLWRRVRGMMSASSPYFSWNRADSPTAAQMRLTEKHLADALTTSFLGLPASDARSTVAIESVSKRRPVSTTKPSVAELPAWSPDFADPASRAADLERQTRILADQIHLPQSVLQSLAAKGSGDAS
jgi:hypothetical protein